MNIVNNKLSHHTTIYSATVVDVADGSQLMLSFLLSNEKNEKKKKNYFTSYSRRRGIAKALTGCQCMESPSGFFKKQNNHNHVRNCHKSVLETIQGFRSLLLLCYCFVIALLLFLYSMITFEPSGIPIFDVC